MIIDILERDFTALYATLFVVCITWFMVLVAICIDLYFGVKKAKQIGECTTSEGFRRTINKATYYYALMMFALFFDGFDVISPYFVPKPLDMVPGRIGLPKGYADGGYTTQEAGGNKQEAKNQPLTANSQLPTAYSVELTAVLDDVKDLLTHLKENGVEAWMVEDAENGKRIKRTIKKFEKIESKNRVK